MITITVYKPDSRKKYDDLTAELLSLDPLSERAAEIRREQASRQRVNDELEQRRIKAMSERPNAFTPTSAPEEGQA